MNTSIRTLLVLTSTLHLIACQGFDGETGDESLGIELRGGALLTLAEGTSIDLDELDEREGYGTTLTDVDNVKWFVRTTQATAVELDELGFETFPWDAGDVYIGTAERDGVDDCQVFMPFAPDAWVLASRPGDELACPSTLDEVRNWLPQIDAVEQEQWWRAFGDQVGTFNSIPAYSNGTVAYNSGQYSTVGLKWQCVEYANRYYYQRYSHRNLKGTGNAKDYFGTANSKDLVAYTNGVSTVAPAVGDMVTSSAQTYGHIAIIRAVGSTYVDVIHQNWTNTTSDNSKRLSLSVSGGKYTIGTFSVDYPVQGWLRRKPLCLPSVSSVSPTTATLNQAKQFTVTGSCLPTTTVPWIADCDGLVVNSRTSTQMVFTCTPKWAIGIKSGVIKHNTDGTVLKNFSVTVN